MRLIADTIKAKRLQPLFHACARLLVPLHELLERHGIEMPPETNPTSRKPLIFEYCDRKSFALHVSEINEGHTIVQSLRHAEHDPQRTFEILRQLNRKPEEIGAVISETWGKDYKANCKLYLR